MNILIDKLVKSQTHRPGHVYENGNLARETESLLITAQNNAIRTNYNKAKIDNTQQNSKCRLSGGKDVTVNYIISECNKLAQKDLARLSEKSDH